MPLRSPCLRGSSVWFSLRQRDAESRRASTTETQRHREEPSICPLCLCVSVVNVSAFSVPPRFLGLVLPSPAQRRTTNMSFSVSPRLCGECLCVLRASAVLARLGPLLAEVLRDRVDERRDCIVRRHDRRLDVVLRRRLGGDRPDRRDGGRPQQIGRRL